MPEIGPVCNALGEAHKGRKIAGEQWAPNPRGDFFRPFTFQNAVVLLLFQAAELSPLAYSRLLSYRDLLHCIPQQFNETLYGPLPIFHLAAGLL